MNIDIVNNVDFVNTVMVVAAEEPQGPEFGKSSPLGLLVILVLLVGTAFLIWSMGRQLKKLPESFDTEHPEADQAFDEGTDPSGPIAAASAPVDAAPDGAVSDGATPDDAAAGDQDATSTTGTDERRPADT
ncbi:MULTISPECIES: hypothetical protein [Gordonia]|uniref:hypothetical protein n=1 Tax=Gordonia TaxID=2053 RepID=UPI0004290B93|nr:MULTISPECIES: hypothetical protein [Gordonia]ATD70190.1 hypothetical protein CNO18_07840 [Gordonia sp. 1D]MBA5849184.1 hypothetical protein [Gordonia amicalis]MDV7173610.1 hypothetical protein [Gordonia amicalis]UKO93745.1 hypothetical protein IHQ52_10925 [Gordonia amicalis]UOG21382.1 hypothetical protein MTX80_21090 [Gordonia amicalis]